MRIRSRGIRPTGQDVHLQWNDQPVVAQAGDTIASALLAAGEPACREAAPGDRRGVFCGMGVCHECAVLVEGDGERLACMTPVREGMRARLGGRLLNLEHTAPEQPLAESLLSPDVLVVGAGPAGLSAAAVAAEHGLSVVVIDDRGKLGGQYYKQPSSSFEVDEEQLDDQYRAGRALMRRAVDAGATVLAGARLWGADSPSRVFVAGPDHRWEVHPGQIVLATGAYERGVPFPGWTLPGVMSTGAAQTMARSYQVSPGDRVLVAGNGPLNLQVAAELTAAGATVVALVELSRPLRLSALLRGPVMALAAPRLLLNGARYGIALARGRVPVLGGHAVVRAEGDPDGVRSVHVAPIDAEGRPALGTTREFDVDAVCLGYGFLPSHELSRLFDCRHRWDDETQSLVVDSDDVGRTSTPGVWVIGDAGSVLGAKVAEARGTLAGAAIVRERAVTASSALTSAERHARRALSRHLRFQRAMQHAFAAPVLTDQLAEPTTTICRCENVALEAISDRLDDLSSTPGAVKRETRAGMGKCQGRYCGPVLLAASARYRQSALEEHSGFAPQAPARPTPISVIARSDSDLHDTA